jgi:hypothetical protein
LWEQSQEFCTSTLLRLVDQGAMCTATEPLKAAMAELDSAIKVARKLGTLRSKPQVDALQRPLWWAFKQLPGGDLLLGCMVLSDDAVELSCCRCWRRPYTRP